MLVLAVFVTGHMTGSGGRGNGFCASRQNIRELLSCVGWV